VSAWRNPQAILLFISLGLLGATFARPTMQLERQTYRYVFVFDISQSMNVKDVGEVETPITRLNYAKQSALESLSMLPCGTEVGLALFTGHRAFLLTTPIETCDNYRELSIMLNNIDWRMTWEARSEIAKGLYKSIALLQQLEGQTRLVFITDGHEAPPINPDLPPRFPGTKGDIGGLIIGVGGKKLVPIPKFDAMGEQQGYWKVDEVSHVDAYTQARNARESTISTASGTEHLSSLRETYLQSLATKTGLTYYRLSGAKDFSQQMRGDTLGIPKIRTTDMRWFLALGALFTFVAAILSTLIGNLKLSDFRRSNPIR
jgi:mxaL protein